MQIILTVWGLALGSLFLFVCVFKHSVAEEYHPTTRENPKYKKIAEQNEHFIEESSKDTKYNNLLYSKLEDLKLPYPTIFYYKDIKNNNFKICYNWFNLDDKIFLETSNKKIIYKKDQGCKKIDKDQIVQLLRGKVYFKTNLNHRIRIYTR